VHYGDKPPSVDRGWLDSLFDPFVKLELKRLVHTR
jgi:hypothetical protein